MTTRPRLLPLALLLAACGGSDTVSADRVRVEGEPLSAVLERLEAQSAQAGAAAAEARAAEPEAAGDVASQLERLDERLTNLELAIANLEQHGIERARVVSYDPRSTKLGGTNVQEALDELEGRVGKVEAKVLDDLGEPGPGLFEVRDRRGGKGKGKGPPPSGGRGRPGGGPGGGPQQQGGPR